MLVNKFVILRLLVVALNASLRACDDGLEFVVDNDDLVLSENATAVELKSAFNLILDTYDMYGLTMGALKTITFTLMAKEPDTVENATLLVIISDTALAVASESSIPLTWMLGDRSSGRLVTLRDSQESSEDPETAAEDKNSTLVDTFLIRGINLGYSSVTLFVEFFNTSLSEFQTIQLIRLPISVKRSLRPIDLAFQVILYVVIVSSGIVTSLKIELDVIKQTLRRPKAPLVGLLSQFITMPLIAYGIVRVRGYTGGTALGLFAMGIGPGGGSSNWYTFLLDGDMSVSITMTLLSTVASLGFLPLWLYTLGSTLPASDTVNQDTLKIPFVNILGTITVLVIPAAVGLLVKWKRPRAAAVIIKWTKVPLMVVALTMIIIAVYSNWFIFARFDAALLFTSAILPYGGFILGGLIAFAARFNSKLIVTIAIETGIQNVGVAIILLQSSLPQPDSDLAMIPALAAQMMTPLPLFVASVIYNLYKRFCKKKSEGSPDELETFENKGAKELTSLDKGHREEKVSLFRGSGEAVA